MKFSNLKNLIVSDLKNKKQSFLTRVCQRVKSLVLPFS